jgi:hypothetical protein
MFQRNPCVDALVLRGNDKGVSSFGDVTNPSLAEIGTDVIDPEAYVGVTAVARGAQSMDCVPSTAHAIP